MSQAEVLLYELSEKSEKKLPDAYPDINIPATAKDLMGTFDDFNKKYFDGILKKNFPVKIANSKGWFGLHTSKIVDGLPKTLSIKINKVIVGDRKKLIDVWIHELIHEWQKEMFRRTKDPKYIDRPPKSRSHAPGHGEHFLSKMNFINSHGFGLEVSSKASDVQTLGSDVEGLVFLTKSNTGVPFVLNKGKLSKEAISTAIETMKDTWGADHFDKVLHIKSSNPQFAMAAFKVSSKGTFRLSSRKSFTDVGIKAFLKDSKTIEDIPIIGLTDIPKGVSSVIPKLGIRISSDFVEFRNIVLRLSDEYPSLTSKDLLRVGENEKVDGVEDAVIEFIRAKWNGIKDSDLKKSTYFSRMDSVFRSVMHGNFDRRGVMQQDPEGEYQRLFGKRVPVQRFADLLYKHVKTKQLARMKKSVGFDKKEASEEIARKWEEVLGGTILMPTKLESTAKQIIRLLK